jgi:hypothetical protein
MTPQSRPIVLMDNDSRTVELVHKAVGGLSDAPPLVVFPDPDSLRQYLSDAESPPVAILLNGQREGTLSLMSWLDAATDTRVIYFGPSLSLPNFYRVDTLGELLTEDVLTDALNDALAEST